LSFVLEKLTSLILPSDSFVILSRNDSSAREVEGPDEQASIANAMSVNKTENSCAFTFPPAGKRT
jgi:hypothetical protein